MSSANQARGFDCKYLDGCKLEELAVRRVPEPLLGRGLLKAYNDDRDESSSKSSGSGSTVDRVSASEQSSNKQSGCGGQTPRLLCPSEQPDFEPSKNCAKSGGICVRCE